MRSPRAVILVGALWAALPIVIGAGGPLSPDVASIQIQLGNSLFGEARYRAAYEAYQRAVQCDEPRLKRGARIGIVRSSLRMAEFRVAAETATMMKAASPRDVEILGLYGDSRWSMGLFDDAEATYRDVLSLDPGNARGHLGLARSLASRSQLEDALAEAQAAVVTAPGDPEIHQALGFIYERLRRYEEAAASLTDCLNLLPNKDRSEQADWARSEVKLLRSFRSREPTRWPDEQVRRTRSVLERDKVIVEARVNGNRQRIDFVLDTGAESTVVSRRTAQRLSIPPVVQLVSAGVGQIGVRTVQVGVLDSLEIGSFKVRNLPVLIKNPPLFDLPTRETDGFSPLAMGLSMSVDYSRRLLTIGPDGGQDPVDVELPLRLHRLATVRGLVDRTHAVNFVVDTGGEVISISAATAGALTKIRDTRRIALKVYGTSGWDPQAYLLPGVDLMFDAIKLENTPVVVLNLGAPSALLGYQLGGIVGHNFLVPVRHRPRAERAQAQADVESRSEVVANPELEPPLPPLVRGHLVPEEQVLPVLVEQGPPGPVEVDREPQREGLEADPVRRPAADQPETGHGHRIPVDRHREPRGRIEDVPHEGSELLRLVGPELETGVVPPAGADVEEQHAADAAEDPDGREHRLDQREPELRVRAHVLAPNCGNRSRASRVPPVN
jgi:Flp pilus assembly protein TadD/predicted aspartyl protease